jgi:8-amino-7-oxononanoate synthase
MNVVPLTFEQQLAAQLESLKQAGQHRRSRLVLPRPGGRCRIDTRDCWNFAGNDYLGLSDHPSLLTAAEAAISQAGLGARASVLVSGYTPWHAELSARLACLKQTPSALLFPSGYAANVGTLCALAGPDDLILCDRLNHASLIDGCRLSRARFQVFPHADAAACRRILSQRTGARRTFIVTESVFSMDGDHAPLAELLQIADAFDAQLVVDEAHATGVFGETGAGLVSALNLPHDRVISIGTLSKALGLQGGFVCGSPLLIDWLWNAARTHMFSTGLSLPVCAAGCAAIELIQTEPERREWLARASAQVISALRADGWNIPAAAVGPVVPVIIGSEAHTMQLARQLEEQGILVAGIRPPTVPKGTSRLRISLSYAVRDGGIDALLQAFRACRQTGPGPQTGQ